ncbi:hypothetical protein F4813DRAFT_48270 [Daldinia decipiens]|uniref:uncharacterized protein n=1 Tax=Daldinia decipiens TaxID=326647 RepID=UPI0020C59AD3|nr:uncharacterized protein F4813DRAFT_48270 [Daldinia decipiens]KAI1658414.1 hypothetical protein F4813DRAFT_48270 [Daldinia decipiens]
MWRLSPTLSAWAFELNLLALQALIPYNTDKKNGSLFRHIRTLTAICFNAIYLVTIKKRATDPALDPESGRPVWRAIYACLFSVFVCTFRTTYNHFTQTTASLKPSREEMSSCYRKTETRRLVPVYRVSYPAFRFLDKLALSIQTMANSPAPLGIPPLVHNGRLNVSGYFKHLLLGPVLRFPSTFPGISGFFWRNRGYIVTILFTIYNYSYEKNAGRLLAVTMIRGFFSFEQIGPEFLWSLTYHDALEVDGIYYEVRSAALFSTRLKIRIRPTKGSSMEKYKRDRQELGYTFYNNDEIEAKARHLTKIVPNYDHLTFNCQAFAQNLFRRIVAHELLPKGKTLPIPPRQRTLHGYHNQRSNALLVLAMFPRFFSRSLGYVLWLPWLNYWYEYLIFATCSWHGKPASNRVALFQLLSSAAFVYVFDLYQISERMREVFPGLDTSIIAPITDANTLRWYEWVLNSDYYLGIISIPITFVNILVKLYLYDQHVDKGLPKIVRTSWHKEGFGFEGMEVGVQHFASDQPTNGYNITPLGLIPKIDHARVNAAAEDTGFDKSAALRIRKGFHKLADLDNEVWTD